MAWVTSAGETFYQPDAPNAQPPNDPYSTENLLAGWGGAGYTGGATSWNNGSTSPMTSGMSQALTSVDPNWSTNPQVVDALKKANVSGQTWGHGMFTDSGTGGVTDMRNQLSQALQSVYPQLAQNQSWTGATNTANQAYDTLNQKNSQDNPFSIPLPVLAVLALMTGGAAGMLGGAGTLAGTAAGGGVVGGGLEGAAVGGAGLGGAEGAVGLGGGLGTGGGEGAVGWNAAGGASAGGASPVGSLGSSGSGSLFDTVRNMYSQAPPGTNTVVKKGIGSLFGGDGSQTSSQQGGAGMANNGGLMDWLLGSGAGSAGGLASGLLSYNAYNDQTDFLKNTMERAISASDPYGYGQYRQPAAQRLEQTYSDPASIWRSPEMQAYDQQQQNAMMARDAASGQLFNAPERLAQREQNFLTNLNEYRKPLMQMSGSQFAPDTRAYSAFANPIVANEISKSGALGGAIGSGVSGIGGLLGGLLGGGQGGGMFGSGAQGGLGSLITSLGSGGGGGAASPALAASIASNGGWDVLPEAASSAGDFADWTDLGGAWGW